MLLTERILSILKNFRSFLNNDKSVKIVALIAIFVLFAAAIIGFKFINNFNENNNLSENSIETEPAVKSIYHLNVHQKNRFIFIIIAVIIFRPVLGIWRISLFILRRVKIHFFPFLKQIHNYIFVVILTAHYILTVSAVYTE